MNNHPQEITNARRKLTLQALTYCCTTFTGDGWATTGQVLKTLKAWIRSGMIEWPKSPWRYGKHEPYYAGVSQHLGQMRGQGAVEWKDGKFRPKTADGGGLRRRAADALRLQSEGKNATEVAETLGISKSLASSLLLDPTGEKERERKRGYCPACGAKKESKATVCPGCQEKAQEKAAALLPPDTFTVYLERAAEQGVEMIFGVTPDFRRVIRVGTWRCFEEHEVRGDLSWLDGLTELQGMIGVELV